MSIGDLPVFCSCWKTMTMSCTFQTSVEEASFVLDTDITETCTIIENRVWPDVVSHCEISSFTFRAGDSHEMDIYAFALLGMAGRRLILLGVALSHYMTVLRGGQPSNLRMDKASRTWLSIGFASTISSLPKIRWRSGVGDDYPCAMQVLIDHSFLGGFSICWQVFNICPHVLCKSMNISGYIHIHPP